MTTAAAVVEPDAQRAHKLSSAKKKVSLLSILRDCRLPQTDTCPQLKQYRASKSTTQSSSSHTSSSPSSSPTKDICSLPSPLPRRVPHGAALSGLSEGALKESDPTPALPPAREDVFNFGQSISRPRHNRVGSRALSSHRRQNSSFSWPRQPPASSASEQANRSSVMGLFDVPPLEHSEQTDDGTEESEGPCSAVDHLQGAPREIVTTPATPPSQASRLPGGDEDKENNHHDDEAAVINRLSSFSFGSKAPQQTRRRPPSFSLRDTSHMTSHSFSAPFVPRRPLSARLMSSSAALPVPLDLSSELSRSTSPQPHRKRHSHNRSESISLPNLKLGGRPTSLGLPSPNLTSASAASSPTVPVSADRRQNAFGVNGSRLKFEPSDKEKEESRRRALDKLTGGAPPPPAPTSTAGKGEIVLPSFEDDEDDMSTCSSRPQSATCTSAASSSRPSSLTVNSASSSSFGITSPLPWSTFDEADRWTAVSQRFEAKEEAPYAGFSFDLQEPTPRPSSVLLNGGLGVLAEEDETESEEAADEEEGSHHLEAAPSDMTLSTDESTPSAPTPSRLRQLHLVSSVSSSSGRRSSNPDVLQSFSRALSQSRETPTKGSAGFGSAGRSGGRPRPLDAPTDWFGSTPSPSKPRPLSTGSYPRGSGTSRTSSISYKKDDSGSGSSRDYGSSRGDADMLSPTSSIDESGPTRSMGRSCPRPRSLILGLSGTSGRVLGEVSEADEDGDDEANTRDSFDSPFWAKRDSRDRIDMELERDALREDVDLWRQRCKGLEDKYEAERRESALLRERVRKLGDRLLTVSSAAPSRPSAAEEHEAAQARLIAEMREQLFSLTAALERERKEKAEAVAQAVELQAMLDALHKTPHVSPHQLPSTPKSRPHPTSISGAMSSPAEAYEDADIYDDVDTYEYGLEPQAYDQVYSQEENQDPNLVRMRGGWGFPQGPVDKSSRESKRESFFGLSRARPVRPAPSISVPGGLGWGTTAQPSPTEPTFDLPPFVVDDSNSSLVTPISPTKTSYTSNANGRPRPISSIGRPPPSLSSYSHTSQTISHTTHATPERQLASSGFGLSFLSGYLSRSTPPQVPLISITPSSVSPKKQLTTLVRQSRSDRHYGSVAPGCDIDFRNSCRRCTGEIIEL